MKQKNINVYMLGNNSCDILYNNFSADEMIPPHNLPLSRHFSNSAYVIMRDSWDFNKNTLLVFKSASFYAAGHHHKDQNAFTIYYKGPLAIDAGTYEAAGGWGCDHFWNYYTRSIAHNTMLIYDPSEKFRDYSNDGGQYFFEINDPYLEDMIEGGENHLDGILRYEENSDYAYTLGDATKAYRSSKLSEYKRSIVYLRNHSYDHPAIIIYDKVISTDSSFKKSYLLHSIEPPTINKNLVRINIHDGMNPENRSALFQETILPQNPIISKIGGRENNQEFFVADDGSGNPHNYNEEAEYDKPSGRNSRELREGGEWRIEVSPGIHQKEDFFMHVLSITDGQEELSEVKAHYVSSKNLDGVIISDNDREQSTLVLFCKKTGLIDDLIIIPPDLTFNKILIEGLEIETQYDISLSEKGYCIRTLPSGKFKSSEQGTLYLDK